jgi:hypothetical protein
MKLGVLLLSVTDTPRVTAISSDWVRRAMERVVDFFTDQSGGREALEFEVFEWFELPVRSAEWNGFGFDAGQHVKPMVSAGLGVDLSGFNHFIPVIDKHDAHLAALAPDGVHVHMSGQDMDPAVVCTTST